MKAHGKLRFLTVTSASLLGLSCIAAGSVDAAPAAVPVQMSESIPRALGLYITSRGQQYFANNLQALFYQMGIQFDNGGFEGWKYEAQEPLSLGNLPVHYQQFSSTLGSVRDIMNHWLRGFDLADPRFTAEFKNIQYSAQMRTFGLHIDQEATARTMNGRGVAVVFEAEIPQIRIEADSVRGNDLANGFLGIFGVDHLWTQIQAHSEPLRIQIPMTLQLNSASDFECRVQGFHTNFASVQLDMGFNHPLLLPTVRMIVNGHKMALNQKHVEEELIRQKQLLLQAIQTYLTELAAEKIPPALSAAVAAKYEHPFSDINEMDPPGAENPGPQDKYFWGIKPEEIQVTPQYLRVGLSAYVDDPRSSNPRAAVSRRLTTRTPMLNLINPSTYDAALVVNEDLVNRILGLGYQRGYFNKIEVTDGAPVRMIAPPEFRFDGSSTHDRGKLHVSIQDKVQGLSQQIAIKSRLNIEMDIVARLIHTADGKVQVLLDQVDLNSIVIDERSIRAGFINMVRNAVRSKLAALNNDLHDKPKVAVENLPVPTEIGGIPLKVKDFQADQNGYMVVYFDYDLSH